MNWLRLLVLRWLGIAYVDVTAISSLRLDNHDMLVIAAPAMSMRRWDALKTEIYDWRKARGLHDVLIVFMESDIKLSVVKNGNPHSDQPSGILIGPHGEQWGYDPDTGHVVRRGNA